MFKAKWLYAAAVAGLCTSASFVVLAADSIKTRSPEAAQADLVRDWNAKPSTQPGSTVRSRNQQNANADLMRDFYSKGSGEQGAGVQQRSSNAMYKDLVRDWSTDQPAAPTKRAEVSSQ
jgi:hypothetical protein